MRCLVVLAAALAASASPVTAATAQQPSRIEVEETGAADPRRAQPGACRSRPRTAAPRDGPARRGGDSLEVDARRRLLRPRICRRHELRSQASEALPRSRWSTWSVGETLLATSAALDARQIVAEWLQSKPHRAVILSATWRDVGIGARYAASAPQEFRGAPTTVVTADFGLREGREGGPLG